VKLSEYVLLSVEERRKHLDISTPCEEPRNNRKRRRQLLELLGLEDDTTFRETGVCVKSLCKSGDGEVSRCTNPKHAWFTQYNERSEDAGRLWLSLSDGFVANAGAMVCHNRAVGAAEDNRVRLTHGEHATLHALYEDVEGKTLKGSRWCGKRLPPEHWPERVKAYLKEKGTT
jgi:hypothetical protein